jgi:predicted flap endonuclease-1-like 5' DNA nuclease
VIDRPLTPAEELAETAPTGSELTTLPGIDLEIMGALVHAGYTTVAQVQAATDAELLAISGIGPVRLAKIRGIIHSGASPLG